MDPDDNSGSSTAKEDELYDVLPAASFRPYTPIKESVSPALSSKSRRRDDHGGRYVDDSPRLGL